MLVGNKLDLASSRKTSREMGQQYAEEEGLLFAEASAKSSEGVEELFMEIGECLHLGYEVVGHLDRRADMGDSEKVAVECPATENEWDRRSRCGCSRT